MHVVIAWWEGASEAEAPGAADSTPPPRTGDFPGLRASRRLTDPDAGRQGLVLVWDSAADAALFLPEIAQRSFGCAPSHRWAFELEDTPRCGGGAGGLPAEVDLLLHV